MRGLINLHIFCILLLRFASRCDGGLLNLLLGLGLSPELAQVGLLWRCWLGSFRHLEESTWEGVNDEYSGLYRGISHQGSTGESYNEEHASGYEASHAR